MQDHDVVGIGNAIVDIIGRCDDAFLAQHGAPRAACSWSMPRRSPSSTTAMGPAVEISGGSVANTMVGIASFGGKAGFIGKIGEDQFGAVFAPRHPRRRRHLHDARRPQRQRSDRAAA